MRAVRATLRGQNVAAIQRRAQDLGLLGWVRSDADGAVRVHAEGPREAVAGLLSSLPGDSAGDPTAADPTQVQDVGVEGHEQFAVRGVPAGVFVVQEHYATAHHFDFRLEVEGVMRSWAVPKGPSLDPAVRRLAVQVEDHAVPHNSYEGARVIVWDRGAYEQGGRVAWPDAFDRGHAVFVLDGEKLSGGFALQRTSPPDAAKPQWLLLKRRDDDARPGSDIVTERPGSVISGRTLSGSA